MAFLGQVLALPVPHQELPIGGANLGCTAFACVPIIVGAVCRFPCVLQRRRSHAMHSAICQREFVLQAKRVRPTTEAYMREQQRHQATICLCGTRPIERAMSRAVLDRIMANALVHTTARRGGEATRPSDGKIKGREVRRGRMGKERRHIRHFARGALRQDSLPICTSHWIIETTHTSRASSS
jgi:hypothetical protein